MKTSYSDEFMGLVIGLILYAWVIYHWGCKPFIFNTLEENKNEGIKIAVVKMLFKVGIDVNAEKYSPILPLMVASKKTPLMVASKNGHTEIVQLLLEKGAYVNAKDNYGETALMLAAANGRTEIVQLLLEKGADVNAKNEYGRTALMYALGNYRTEIIQLLLEKGADVNAKNKYGSTALMFAASNGRTEIVQILLEKGGRCECEK